MANRSLKNISQCCQLILAVSLVCMSCEPSAFLAYAQEDFECLDVSIWDQLQEENTSTIWRDALYSVGLNKLLQDTKPGEALFVPADSSLIGQCSAEDALLCATQRLDWYKYLTNTTGVGLLMLHWIPGGWLNSGIFPGDILLLGPNGTFDTGVQTQLTINLLKQNPGTKWHMGYGNNGTRPYIKLANAETESQFNGVPSGSVSNIIKTIPTCNKGTLFIIDRPLVPKHLSTATVNDFSSLKDFCWTNALNLVTQPRFRTEFTFRLNALFFPDSIPVLADARRNGTYFIMDGEVLNALYGSGFQAAIESDPVKFGLTYASKVMSNTLNGGYCPQALNGKMFNTMTGELLNTSYPISIEVIPRAEDINAVNSSQITVASTYSNSTAVYVGAACYTHIYYLTDYPIAMWPDILESVPEMDPALVNLVATVTEQELYGVEPLCRPGDDTIQQQPQYKAEETSESSSNDGLSDGAIAGIVVGSVACVAAVGLVVMTVLKKRKKSGSTVLPTYNKSPTNGLNGLLHPRSNSERSSDWDKNSAASLPSVPWNEFVLQAEDFDFKIDPVTKERVLVGAGRFGRVYMGVLHGSADVAIKCIGEDSVSNSQLGELSKLSHLSEMGSDKPLTSNELKRNAHILQEVSLLKACRSPHIVNFMGACFQPKEVQLVTEIMHGGDLWRALRARSINWYNGGNNVAIDVIAGLTYLHRHRVVHLDLKSNNILLTGDPEVRAKISDVGLAQILPVSQEYIASGIGNGTWHWAPPEVILGHRCTSAADIWSFGVVLWEICTGEPPIRGQMRDPNVPDECPQEIANLMTECWNTDAPSRPTAAQVLARLQPFSTRSSMVITPSTSVPTSGESFTAK